MGIDSYIIDLMERLEEGNPPNEDAQKAIQSLKDYETSRSEIPCGNVPKDICDPNLRKNKIAERVSITKVDVK
ncbi:hypothetical protein DLAC_10488 [Tieghemostelium lacteum]|uniref:Uncharacterized protein n=1 Tax=Tieghemostelium lacteum TaxID=361077 RepID=A0A151Z4N7_TIELA|nr:hypothetical protein DLAC_10488 [Tieghemostelium lacteum]|eukprot:KYQ88905.1 hypothetical protein DLAC_10488 [Tieghemostelium lacteum]